VAEHTQHQEAYAYICLSLLMTIEDICMCYFSKTVFRSSTGNTMVLFNCIRTLSRGRSLPVLARPPQRSDEPRTRSKLDNMEPKRDHFRISIFSLCRANSAIISSGTFPQVAFRSPPAVIKIVPIHIEVPSQKKERTVNAVLRRSKCLNIRILGFLNQL